MSNGLCKLTDYVVDTVLEQSTFVHGSCSNKAWGLKYSNFCLTGMNGDTLVAAMGLAQCLGTSMGQYHCSIEA
jgi:hypothetical protein